LPIPARFAWTAEAIATLTAAWHSGTVTRQIGAQLGCTHNAVVGMVHRLGLPGRPSPIVRDPNRPPAPRPQLAPPRAMFAQAARRPAPPPPASPQLASGHRCQFPLWPDSEAPPRPARFCDQPVTLRHDGTPSSWCAEHHARAFQPGWKPRSF
jgi:GcrA cell cycle regulator